MNRRMRSCLGQSNLADFAKDEKLSEQLSQLLVSGFTNFHEAIVFTALSNIARNVTRKNFPDLTGFECFVNHIHIEDRLDGHVLDHTGLLKQAIAFALATESQLRSTFPGQLFNVIVAATAQRSGVRFHLVRPGEEWLASDLEGYADEAILVLEA